MIFCHCQTGEEIGTHGEDATSLRCHQDKMQAERLKKHPNLCILKDKMVQTRVERRQYLEKYSTLEQQQATVLDLFSLYEEAKNGCAEEAHRGNINTWLSIIREAITWAISGCNLCNCVLIYVNLVFTLTLTFTEKYFMSNAPQGKISPTFIKMAKYLFS